MKSKTFKANIDVEALELIEKFLAEGYKEREYRDPKCILFEYDPDTEYHYLTLVYEVI